MKKAQTSLVYVNGSSVQMELPELIINHKIYYLVSRDYAPDQKEKIYKSLEYLGKHKGFNSTCQRHNIWVYKQHFTQILSS